MNRPRDRASAAGLLPRMEARPWADGKTITYRYHPIGGKPVNLGTDRAEACRRVLELNGQADVMRATATPTGGRNADEKLMDYVARANQIQGAAIARWMTAKAEFESAEAALLAAAGKGNKP
jgi:hypothetical protein